MSGEISPRTPFYGPEALEIAKDALLRACKATKKVRERNERTGKIDYVDVPAWEFIIPAATKVIEFGRGKAVATTVVANLDASASSDPSREFLTSLAADPGAIAALEDTVAKIKDTARKLKRAEPIEVSVTQSLPERRPSSS